MPQDAQVDGMNGIEHDDRPMQTQEEQQDPAASNAVGMTGERQPNKVRVTTPYLTKYERARILGTRALQIRYAVKSLSNLLRNAQYECACARASRWRNRRFANCNKRAISAKNPSHHPAVSPRRQFRRLERLGTY